MEKLLFQFSCLLTVLIFSSAVESDQNKNSNERTYNLNDLISNSFNHLHTSRYFKDVSPNLLRDLPFKGIDLNFETEPREDLSHNSSRCMADIYFTLLSIDELWALRLLDSFGKPESGIFRGNTKFVGNYNECIKVRSTYTNATVGNFNGKYCSLSISIPVMNKTMPFPFTIGICVPDSCSDQDLQDNVLEISRIAGFIPALNGTPITLSCQPNERPLNSSAKAVIVLLSIFCFLALLGSSFTVADYVTKTESKETSHILSVSVSDRGIGDDPDAMKMNNGGLVLMTGTDMDNENSGLQKAKKFLKCFCVFTNGAKLLNTDSSEGQLLSIHGIRFLSMSWVILGHSYAFMIHNVANILDAGTVVDSFAFQVVFQAFYSVDSFFLLSGFLLTYLAMKEFSKTKGVGISWPYFYIHRYVRLTPIYMIVLAFSATIYLYLGSGPFWPVDDVDPNCRHYWWWNLLYINNFDEMDHMCMGWSWYLSNDMQFFVFSPLFLITLWKWPPVGYGLIGISMVASFFSNFFITYHYDLVAGLGDTLSHAVEGDLTQTMAKYLLYFDKIYTKPYTRMSPYLIGILLGYLLFKRRALNNPKHSLLFLSIGWIVATTITLLAVYGLYHSHLTVIASSFYNALHRTTFALGLSWVIYVCLIGQGGPLDKILSYKLFIPLSRLTYAAYLIHPMIINGYYASLKTTFFFSHPTVVFLFLGFMVVTYLLALPVALILESPIVSLEKVIRNSFTRKGKS